MCFEIKHIGIKTSGMDHYRLSTRLDAVIGLIWRLSEKKGKRRKKLVIQDLIVGGSKLFLN